MVLLVKKASTLPIPVAKPANMVSPNAKRISLAESTTALGKRIYYLLSLKYEKKVKLRFHAFSDNQSGYYAEYSY